MPTDRVSARPRVLLVEDDDGFAKLVRVLIDVEGKGRYELDHASSLAAAAERLRAGPDVAAVLLDLSLPDASGFETVTRANKLAPNAAIIVVTGRVDDDLALNAMASGAQDYLIKGDLRGQVLLRAIEYAIARKELELERVGLIEELRRALAQVKTLEGLLPICAKCKKIRDERDHWVAVEGYVRARTNADFTHGICPGCEEELYGTSANPVSAQGEGAGHGR